MYGSHVCNTKPQGCRLCGIEKRSKNTYESFVRDIDQKFNGKYIVIPFEYISTAKVTLVCPTHGNFEKTIGNHLQGDGCPKCVFNKRFKTFEEFVKDANEIHQFAYSYQEKGYKDTKTEITIECNVHGNFNMRPNSHLSGQGCPKCGKESTKSKLSVFKTFEDLVIKCQSIHGNTYKYINSSGLLYKDTVKYICNTHGEIETSLASHLRGHGCEQCSYDGRGLKKRNTLEYFINKATEVHGNNYDYSKFNYVSNKTKGIVVCKECDLNFEVRPDSHLFNSTGCPCCNKGGIYSVEAIFDKGIENDPCNLYFVKFSNKEESFLKIGLTKFDVKTRFSGKSYSQYSIEVLKLYELTTLKAFFIEQKLLIEFREYQYKPQMLFSGYTECFNVINLEEIKSVLSEMIETNLS